MNLHFTPARCFIDLGAIVHNFRLLGEPDRLMPVVKADAYGHGLMPVANALVDAGARALAVGITSEGVALREGAINVPVLLLMGCQSPDDWADAIANDLMPIIASMDDLQKAASALNNFPGKILDVAIKCDSGMGRLGFAHQHGAAVADALSTFPNINPVLAVSHLACADIPDHDFHTVAQIQAFENFYTSLKARFPAIRPSLNNSAALIRKIPGDVARPGIALYGANPLGNHQSPPLRRAMSLCAPILSVQNLMPGQTVSYGAKYTAQKPMQVAVVPMGYASGFNRKLGGRAEILVHGQRCPQIGTVCMSMLMLDVTGVENVQAGDSAWIMGGEAVPPHQPVEPWELAEWLDTIPYEIFCLFGSLNPRIYDGQD